MQVTAAFLDTDNELSGRQIKKITPFTITVKRLNCLGIKFILEGERPIH